MSDLNPKGIRIKLGEEEHDLLFTINAIDKIQSETERPIWDVIKMVASAADGEISSGPLHAFRTVLTVLLQEDGSELTEKEVGKIVTMSNYRDLAFSILSAFGISIPEPNEDEDEDDPKAKTAEA